MDIIPWVLALATAVWLGATSSRAGRSWLFWAIGGAVYGLIVGTIVLGVTEAAFIPISWSASVRHRIFSVILAAAIIFVLGWISSARLRKPRPTPEPAPTDTPRQAANSR